ncbi:MAG: hypothetical protein J5747_03655, partial [Spirochaetaceae bacterium]|nr:hypothetical protein [Spirochaetaceae bacterium]
GDIKSSEKAICVTFSADIFLSASFEEIPPPEPEPEPLPEPDPVTYSLTVRCEDGGSIVNSAGDKTVFNEGERCMLTAVPENGYTFAGWTGDMGSFLKTICVTFDTDIFLSASFEEIPPEPLPEPEPAPVTYSLTVRCETGGSVVSSAGDKTVFNEGERCMLTAVPENGYTFAGWTGDMGSFLKTICVTFDTDIFLSASFEEIPPERNFLLSVDTDGNGGVEAVPSKSVYSGGETVSVRAVPDDGFMFSCWSDGITEPERIIVMNDDTEIAAEFIKRNWTIVMYMAADNDLESAAILDINEMEAADFKNGGITVLALVDRAEGYDGTNGNWTDTRLYEIKHDEDGLNGNIISERISCNTLGLFADADSELNMADPNVLHNVLRFAQKQYPASDYALVMWGHGTGWRGGGTVVAYDCSLYGRAFAIDDYSASYMTISQVHEAISKLPKKLSFIGFDTCYGALLESAWEFRNDAAYMVGSENIVPSNGWNYQTFLDSAAAETCQNATDSHPEKLADCVVSAFSEQYSGLQSASISKVNLSKVEGLKTAFEKFCASVVCGITSSSAARNVLSCVMNKVMAFYFPGSACDMFIDLYSFVYEINAAKDLIFGQPEDVTGTFTSMDSRRASFVTALNKAVSSWCGSGQKTARLGIYFSPLSSSGVPTYNFSPAYTKNSGDLTQSAFVAESQNWVPDRNTTTPSVLNRIFFTEF